MGLQLYGIPNIADQRAFLEAEGAKVEEVAPCGGGFVHEKIGKIFEPDAILEIDNKDWSLKGIMTAEEVENRRPRGKMRPLLEKCRSRSVELPTDIMNVVALAGRSLDSKRTVTKRNQAPVEAKQKL